jgi:hypothetical protein
MIGILAYRQARHAEVGRLFLHAARIGHDHSGVPLQSEELQIRQGPGLQQPGELQLMIPVSL